MNHRDRIEDVQCESVANRHSPTPWPSMVIVRERLNDDGSVEAVSRRRVYSHILGGDHIVEELVNGQA